ncbi:MAG: hypothetical protein ACRD51_12130 [Candidatus Acidiferrum sp.]
MRRSGRLCRLGFGLISACCLLGYAPGSLAQSQSQAASKPETPVARAVANTSRQENIRGGKTHRFWDKQNDWLFAGVGAARTLDYFSTLNMRRRGRQEIFLTNDAVDNHAAFAAIEASATAISIGASYLFHRYGHHKLERWTSYLHIGLATTGSVRNYCLKTAHAMASPGSP